MESNNSLKIKLPHVNEGIICRSVCPKITHQKTKRLAKASCQRSSDDTCSGGEAKRFKTESSKATGAPNATDGKKQMPAMKIILSNQLIKRNGQGYGIAFMGDAGDQNIPAEFYYVANTENLPEVFKEHVVVDEEVLRSFKDAALLQMYNIFTKMTLLQSKLDEATFASHQEIYLKHTITFGEQGVRQVMSDCHHLHDGEIQACVYGISSILWPQHEDSAKVDEDVPYSVASKKRGNDNTELEDKNQDELILRLASLNISSDKEKGLKNTPCNNASDYWAYERDICEKINAAFNKLLRSFGMTGSFKVNHVLKLLDIYVAVLPMAGSPRGGMISVFYLDTAKRFVIGTAFLLAVLEIITSVSFEMFIGFDRDMEMWQRLHCYRLMTQFYQRHSTRQYLFFVPYEVAIHPGNRGDYHRSLLIQRFGSGNQQKQGE